MGDDISEDMENLDFCSIFRKLKEAKMGIKEDAKKDCMRARFSEAYLAPRFKFYQIISYKKTEQA